MGRPMKPPIRSARTQSTRRSTKIWSWRSKIENVPREDRLPLRPPNEPPALAPPWVALITAWGGLLVMIAAIVFVLLPGSRDPVAELQHRKPYSLQDRFLPYPIYGVAVVLFLVMVVLWQMRIRPRPFPRGLAN